MAEHNQNNEVTIGDVMDFLKEHMVMSEDFDNGIKTLDNKLSDKIQKLDDKLSDKIQKLDDKLSDKIQKSEDKVMARLGEIQLEIEDIKTRLDKIEKTLKEDADALAMEVVSLKKRVAVLEQHFGMQRAAAQA